MNNDINLTEGAKGAENQSKVFIACLVLFVIIFFIAALLVSYSLFLKGQASNLQNQVVALDRQISSFSKQKETALVISERLVGVKKTLASRGKIPALTSSILASLPPAFEIEAVKTEADLISVTFSNSMLASFDSFLEGKVFKDKLPEIKRIDISSFTKVGNKYNLSLDFYFKEVKK